ncbi:MAG TPA: MarR family winged helix-turn-helix transcriptional regulator [Myxococcota bacterium]
MDLPIDPNDCNCLAVRQAARQITKLYDDALAPYGLRATQFGVLSRLARTGPLPVLALAEALAIDRTTLSHNLQPLERDGLVVSATDDADRRVRRIALTAAGKKKLLAAKSAWARAQRRFHEAYGADDAALLRTSLRRAAAVAVVD